MTKAEIVAAVREAGVVGAGGGGFPSHVKFDANVDIVIANGSECEPLLESDKAFMRDRADLVVEGVKLAMEASGATQGFIGVKEYYTDVVAALEKALKEVGDSKIKLAPLENYYPAGDEFLLVYDVCGRIIPEGGLPLHVGVLVSNVVTLAQAFQAVNGKPVTERILTIAGNVHEPKVVTVPIGTSYEDLLKMAGGAKNPDDVVIDGGPMMGNIVDDLKTGIAKTCSGILVLPREHFIVQMKIKTVVQMVKLSKAACCQCFRCTDMCPRNLLGHEIFPHMTMRTIDYNLSEPTQHITSAFLCSQCGVCELIACDFMHLSPKKIYAEYKKQLIAKGVKNPHTRTDVAINSQYENRKVSISMVLKKLGLSDFKRNLPYEGLQSVKRVRVPIKKHIGSGANPVVERNQKVRFGDLIAEIPENKLGARYHASIEGTIKEITDEWIEIEARIQ